MGEIVRKIPVRYIQEILPADTPPPRYFFPIGPRNDTRAPVTILGHHHSEDKGPVVEILRIFKTDTIVLIQFWAHGTTTRIIPSFPLQPHSEG